MVEKKKTKKKEKKIKKEQQQQQQQKKGTSGGPSAFRKNGGRNRPLRTGVKKKERKDTRKDNQNK